MKRALARAPHDEEMLLFYSSELGKRGRPGEIIPLLKAEEPLPLSLTINLALAHSQIGEGEKGREVLKHYLQRPDLSREDKSRAERILKEFEKPS